MTDFPGRVEPLPSHCVPLLRKIAPAKA